MSQPVQPKLFPIHVSDVGIILCCPKIRRKAKELEHNEEQNSNLIHWLLFNKVIPYASQWSERTKCFQFVGKSSYQNCPFLPQKIVPLHF